MVRSSPLPKQQRWKQKVARSCSCGSTVGCRRERPQTGLAHIPCLDCYLCGQEWRENVPSRALSKYRTLAGLFHSTASRKCLTSANPPPHARLNFSRSTRVFQKCHRSINKKLTRVRQRGRPTTDGASKTKTLPQQDLQLQTPIASSPVAQVSIIRAH